MLLNSLCKYGKEANLRNVELFSIHTEGHAVYTEPEYEGRDVIEHFNCIILQLFFFIL